jgi:hypothetical protein
MPVTNKYRYAFYHVLRLPNSPQQSLRLIEIHNLLFFIATPERTPELSLDSSRRDIVHSDRLEIHSKASRHTLLSRSPTCHHTPAGSRLRAIHAADWGDRRLIRPMHILWSKLSHKECPHEANFAVLLDILSSHIADLDQPEAVARGIGNVIELAVLSCEFEERLQAPFHVWAGKVAWVARDTVFGIWIAGSESLDGFVDLLLT